MIVKLIAPGIIPGDYVTVDLQGVPNRGDTVLVETPDYANDTVTEELLTVAKVIWPIEILPSILHGAVPGLVEVVCERTPDAWLTQHVESGTVDPETIREHIQMQYQSPTERQ